MMEQYIDDPDFGKLRVEESESFTKDGKMFILGQYVFLKMRIVTHVQLNGINDKIRNAFRDFNKTIGKKKAVLPDLLMEYYLDNYDVINEWFPIPPEIDKESITKEKIQRLVRVTELVFNSDGMYGFICSTVWDEEHEIAIILSGEKIVITEETEQLF